MNKEIQISRSPEEWAAYIREPYENAVQSIIETGNRLIEAKKDAGHGNWLKVVELLPFSHSTASKFMAIAENKSISNLSHVTSLPASWGTLYALTQLPTRELNQKIKSGEINPDLERKTVEAWVREKKEPKTEKSVPIHEQEPQEVEFWEDTPEIDDSDLLQENLENRREFWENRTQDDKPEPAPHDYDGWVNLELESLFRVLNAIDRQIEQTSEVTKSRVNTEFTRAKEFMAEIKKKTK